MQKIDEVYYNKYISTVSQFKKIKMLSALNKEDCFREWESYNSVITPLQYRKKLRERYYVYINSLEHLKSEFIDENLLCSTYRDVIDYEIERARAGAAQRSQDDVGVKKSLSYLYGLPGEELKNYCLAYIKQYLLRKNIQTHKNNEVIINAYKRFEAYTKDCNTHDLIGDLLKEQVAVKRDVTLINSRDIEVQIQNMLKRLNISGWSTHITDGGSTWVRINKEKRKVIIPSSFLKSQEKVDSLILHEIIVHVQRHFNGESSSLGLLEIGLPHYLKGEEGIAKYMEFFEAHYKKRSRFIDLALGICFVEGLFDNKQHDMNETLQFFEDLWIIINPRKSLKKGIITSKRWTWERTYRIFRGTTGMTKGAYNPKDKLYLEGFLDVYQSTLTFPDEIHRWFKGVYDPSNQKHKEILDCCGF